MNISGLTSSYVVNKITFSYWAGATGATELAPSLQQLPPSPGTPKTLWNVIQTSVFALGTQCTRIGPTPIFVQTTPFWEAITPASP